MIRVHFKGAVIECETDQVCRQVLEQIASLQQDQSVNERLEGWTTTRSLRIGDRFVWIDPPKGWASEIGGRPLKLVAVDEIPAQALPEGWDFFDLSVLNNSIKLIDDRPWAYKIGQTSPSMIPPGQYVAKLCQHCGVVLIKGPTEMDLERYERGVCGGCQ